MTAQASTHGFGLAVNVAVLDGDRVLLTKRADFGVWCLPGGAVDPGESFGEAAIREVQEETGLVVVLDRLVGLYSRPRMGGYHTCALLAAHAAGGEPHPDVTEVTEIGWFAIEDLPKGLLWGQRERIAYALAGVGGSIVRTSDGVRPADWPASRDEQYAMRDASGLEAAAFYAVIAADLGSDESRCEVEGRPSG